MTSLFSAEVGPIWIKFWRRYEMNWIELSCVSKSPHAEWHVDCGDVVEIETRCRIPIWRTFGQIRWHVIPEPHATAHITGCSHQAKSMSWSANRDNPDISGLIDPAARACIALFTATAVDYRNNLHLSAHHRTVRWSDSLGSPRLIDSKIMATGRVVGVVVY